MNLFSRLIILTGHRKSGTSMFQRLFDGHPDLYIFPIDIGVLYAYFPHFTSKFKDDSDELENRLRIVLTKSIEYIEGNIHDSVGFSITNYVDAVLDKLKSDDLIKKEKIIYAIANTWIEQYYKTEDIKPFVFKETTQSMFLNEFLDFETPVKLIALVRDPRDNYAAIKAGVPKYYSKLNESELESLASVINRARIDLLSAKHHSEFSKDSFRAIKFEDLVSNVEKTMSIVTEFLNIDFSSCLLTPTELGNSYGGNNYDGNKFKGVSIENLGNWRNRISNEEAKIIEYWMADVMSFWSYSLDFKPLESEQAFNKFYNWYNIRYFYRDSFGL